MLKKIGFWSVFAIVMSSQIGSGILILPATLTPFGLYSALGWIISGLGAIALALVFAGLCQRFPRTGGPHVYIQAVFGDTAAFFTGWTYWLISWFSTTAVVIASIGYLSPFIRAQSPYINFMLEVFLLVSITWLNLKGTRFAGRTGLILTVLKTIPLFILPLAAFWSFDIHNFVVNHAVHNLPLSSILAQVTLLTLWGFIGLETATASAGSVHNPEKNIPKAIILGTAFVAIIYFINSLGIMGLMPSEVLSHSQAPYIDATRYLLGGEWHLVVALIAAIICVGTLNAWMLASGHVALGLAEDRLLPHRFAQRNATGAPIFGLLISAGCILPFLGLMLKSSMAQQISAVIDYSVTAFLYVYLLCTAAYMKILFQEKKRGWHWIYASGSALFCLWVLSETSLKTLGISALFILSGIPLYWIWYRRTRNA